METLKNILWNVLKYALLAGGVVVLTGYLAVKDKLPALVPDQLAHRMKDMTLELIARPSAQVKSVSGVPSSKVAAASVRPVVRTAPFSLGYRLLDTMLLDRRASALSAAAALNIRRTEDALEETGRFLSAVAASEFAGEFFSEPRKSDREFPLRAYLDKFIFESDLLVGYEIFDERGRLIAPGRYEFPSPSAEAVPSPEGAGLLRSYELQSQTYIAVQQPVVVRSRTAGSIRLIYNGSFLDYFTLPSRFPCAVVIADRQSRLVYSSVNGVDRSVALRLEDLRRRNPAVNKVVDQSRTWRVTSMEAGEGLSVAYFFLPVPAWKVVLNSAIYLCGLALLYLLVRLSLSVAAWARSMTAEEGGRKDEVVTGAIAEVAKTLKNTAELAARMTESSREDLASLKKTVERTRSGSPVKPAAVPAAGQGEEENGWEVM
jgi:hypothetical protein